VSAPFPSGSEWNSGSLEKDCWPLRGPPPSHGRKRPPAHSILEDLDYRSIKSPSRLRMCRDRRSLPAARRKVDYPFHAGSPKPAGCCALGQIRAGIALLLRKACRHDPGLLTLRPSRKSRRYQILGAWDWAAGRSSFPSTCGAPKRSAAIAAASKRPASSDLALTVAVMAAWSTNPRSPGSRFGVACAGERVLFKNGRSGRWRKGHRPGLLRESRK